MVDWRQVINEFWVQKIHKRAFENYDPAWENGAIKVLDLLVDWLNDKYNDD